MTRDPMQVLSRIRGAAVAEARRALAVALTAEHRCEGEVQQAWDMMHQEQHRAARLDALVFIEWLPHARARVARAEQALRLAAAEVARWRAELTARRAAAEAVATLLRKRAAEQALLAARRDQAMLDEAGARMLRQRA